MRWEGERGGGMRAASPDVSEPSEGRISQGGRNGSMGSSLMPGLSIGRSLAGTAGDAGVAQGRHALRALRTWAPALPVALRGGCDGQDEPTAASSRRLQRCPSVGQDYAMLVHRRALNALAWKPDWTGPFHRARKVSNVPAISRRRKHTLPGKRPTGGMGARLSEKGYSPRTETDKKHITPH